MEELVPVSSPEMAASLVADAAAEASCQLPVTEMAAEVVVVGARAEPQPVRLTQARARPAPRERLARERRSDIGTPGPGRLGRMELSMAPECGGDESRDWGMVAAIGDAGSIWNSVLLHGSPALAATT